VVVKADQVQDFGHAAPDFGRGAPLHLERKGNVLCRRHVRKQRIVLEHHAEGTRLGRRCGHVLPVECQPAACRRLKAGQDHQEGGFARARRLQQGQELAPPDRHHNPVERGEPAEILTDPDRADLGHTGACTHRHLPAGSMVGGVSPLRQAKRFHRTGKRNSPTRSSQRIGDSAAIQARKATTTGLAAFSGGTTKK
jgi:hypothetical protein